ncbi:Wzz/FepE/Etk N-terminal domain-containing protein [Paludibacterium denitrificans]|uniref:Polysaccharide chain length determinant N-terminal domain-containing protein n=1 Tax=Paludibacterium denitrificans TaxID=2675226 RepID=A0A844GDF6_9NEIS|nr:Wzz/FepE/Etk N-terminal domain-containing protein [Paludibacterium denitrificans]MTD33360.1 hypothetical protein [Paludibacterium denitrificans]
MTPDTPRMHPSSSIEEDEISLLDILLALAKHKRLLIGITASAFLVSAGVSYLLPKQYEASAVLAMSAPNNAMLTLAQSTSADLLTTLPACQSKEKHCGVEVAMDNKTGQIAIKVQSSDPALAKQTANSATEAVRQANLISGVTPSANQYQLLTLLKKRNHADIQQLEKQLKEAISVETATERWPDAKALADMQAELTLLRYAFSNTSNTTVKVNQIDTTSLKNTLDTLVGKKMAYPANTAQTAVLQKWMTLQSLEQKIAEQLPLLRDQASIELSAIPASQPTLPVKPKRNLIIALSTAGGLFASVLLALLLESWQRLTQDGESREKIAQIKAALRR